jgi:two-component system chemotaxis response regulator CheY
MMSKKVVIVDDSATVLMSADMALESLIDSGIITLQTYSNPLELLANAQDGTLDFDLLITDINMPQMYGIDLIKQLRQIPACKAKPMFALTTENSAQMKELGKSVGLNGWVTKPFSNEKLQMAVKTALRIR